MGGLSNECEPLFKPGQEITCHAKAAVKGRQFVTVVDPIQDGIEVSDKVAGGNIVVGANVAAKRPFGVAQHDAAAGEKVTVYRGKYILPVQASAAAIAAGKEVEVADTAGTVKVLASGEAVGVALTTAKASEVVIVALY